MQIVPTLLTTTSEEFIHQMEVFQPLFPRIQLDIADGKLVPNHTTQLDDMIRLIDDKKITIEKRTIFDLHLMVENYTHELEKAAQLASRGVTIGLVLINARHRISFSEIQKSFPFVIGLDIFPQTKIAEVKNWYDLSLVSGIQIMTVKPGFQGSPFLPEMLTKIADLRERGYAGEILIDGGVNESTLKVIDTLEKKPDILCIGSYLTKASREIKTRVEKLSRLI